MKKYFQSLMAGLMALCLTGIMLSCSNAADEASGGSSEKKPATYTITFNANDGSAQPATATQTFTEGKAQTLKTITELGFSKTGHNFAGWGLTADAAQSSYVDGATYTATSGVTFYALWSLIPVKKYHVSVVSDGHGTASASSEDAAEGTEVTINLVPENGYEMSSLSVIAADSNPITVTNGKFIMPACDVTVNINFVFTGTFYANLDNLADVLSQLSDYATIVMTGNLTSSDMKTIKNLINNSQLFINLNLSNVTGLTTIEFEDFRDCSKLCGISLPDSIKEIKDSAFNGCTSLESIELPNSITTLGQNAFANCKGLKSIKISNSTTIIGAYAFYACLNLESIEIPDTVISIGEGAFELCGKLKNVKLSKSISTIEDSLFYYCRSLESIIIPDGVLSIGRDVFRGCTNLKTIKIPNGVTSIGSCAFFECSNLSSIDLPNTIKVIESSAFSSSGITSITIPDGVSKIESGTFYYCKKLESIVLPKKLTSIGSQAFYACKALSEITIPETVTSIGKEAFFECDELQNITVPASVVTLGTCPFGQCQKLLSINVDDKNPNYKSIDGVLFTIDQKRLINWPCGRSGDYIIPDNVELIEYRAFSSAKKVTSITISNSVKYIMNCAFGYSTAKSIIFKDTNGWYYTNNEDDWQNMTNGTVMPDLTNPSETASNLETYTKYLKYFLYKLP